MTARLIRPISSLEFSHMMQNATPPVGWSETIGKCLTPRLDRILKLTLALVEAVANSGGPDSVCLMFLINRYIKDRHGTKVANSFPKSLVSLTIDHDLQTSSVEMARHASRIAQSLGVQQVTKKLRWGEGMHPPKPGPNEKIEELARDMRYSTLMELMIGSNANSLALGHHCDDQVETMLMRLGRGSSQLGLGGMKPCRRWGMGTRNREPNSLHQVEEMRRWIVRPLLSVEKDRLLATCEQQKLEYVSDPTNFQPQLTIRNAIRHVINRGGLKKSEKNSTFRDFPSRISTQLTNINLAAAMEYKGTFDLASNIDHLREVSAKMSSSAQHIDRCVDDVIAKYKIPSPPGTFMISPLSLLDIGLPVVREALIYRVVRYASPEPWGSPRSELGRRKVSVERLLKHLSNFQQHRSRNNNSICVGSGVWWRLVSMVKGRLRSGIRNVDVSELAWIALRQPRSRSNNVSDPLRIDVTDTIVKARNAWLTHSISPMLEIIFDNRFILRFFVDRIPAPILKSMAQDGRIFIEPRRIWVMPQVALLDGENSTVIHTDISQEPFSADLRLGSEQYQIIKSHWITAHYFRPLTAI